MKLCIQSPVVRPAFRTLLKLQNQPWHSFFFYFYLKRNSHLTIYFDHVFPPLPISPRSSSPHYLVNCICFLSLSLSNKTQAKNQNKIINKTKNALNKTNEENTPQNPNKTWSLFVLANFLWVWRLPCDVFDILRVTPLEETSFHIPAGMNCKQLLG